MLDAYGRLTVTGGSWLSVDSPDHQSVMFVDIATPDNHDPVDLAARIRSAPPALTASTGTLVARVIGSSSPDWEAALIRELFEILERLHLHPDISLLTMRVGQPPRQVVGEPDGTITETDCNLRLVGRARRIELATTLRHNNGVWRPNDYHFRLPSGAHGNCFVRVADAIRTPRDATVLASWLCPHVGENTGILLDSASLVAIAAALETLVSRSGGELGPVVSLEEYPKNRLDTMKAVRDVDRGSNVVALLSVHSTGSVFDRLQEALFQVASHEWTLQIMVDKAGTPGEEAVTLPFREASTFDRKDVWVRLGEERDVPPDDCVSCRRGPARVAQIDPRTFDGMVLPSPELLMPSAAWAFRHRRFWELVDNADAVTIESPSDVSRLHPRYGTDKFMSVKINFADLLADEQFEEVASASLLRVKELVAEQRLSAQYDVLLIDEREAEIPNIISYVTRLSAALGMPETVTVSAALGDLEDGDRNRILRAERILLFRLGIVSGLSLQQTMYAVQNIRRRSGKYSLDGLIVHLRPQDGRIRETLENSLARHLAFMWESYLPEDRHPLEEEREVIATMHSELEPRVQAFLDDRLALCSGFPADGQLLWHAGSHLGDSAARLSPMSYFGENLRVRSAYAAIGAAVHHARIKADAPRSAPVWRMFDLQAILRSYYDPIIIACVLRWLRPTEVWWGDNNEVAQSVVTSVLRRTQGVEQVMLTAELLLAAAQAKIPSQMYEFLTWEAELLANRVGPEEDASLRLGLELLHEISEGPASG